MAKYCEVCDCRIIGSGRKYCAEHRNTKSISNRDPYRILLERFAMGKITSKQLEISQNVLKQLEEKEFEEERKLEEIEEKKFEEERKLEEKEKKLEELEKNKILKKKAREKEREEKELSEEKNTERVAKTTMWGVGITSVTTLIMGIGGFVIGIIATIVIYFLTDEDLRNNPPPKNEVERDSLQEYEEDLINQSWEVKE